MPKFATKQVLFDAVQIPAVGADFPTDVADLEWALNAALDGRIRKIETGVSVSLADQGQQTGAPGDWLMRAADGSIFVCEAAAFAERYEAVHDAAPAA